MLKTGLKSLLLDTCYQKVLYFDKGLIAVYLAFNVLGSKTAKFDPFFQRPVSVLVVSMLMGLKCRMILAVEVVSVLWPILK